jgi:hypothetical protein
MWVGGYPAKQNPRFIMSNPNKTLQQHLINSKVKTAILFLTSDRIPAEENFDFVLSALENCSLKEARTLLYENYYDEILDWSNMNEW